MSFNFQTIAPYLGAVGNRLVNLDPNSSGPDDFAGNLLIYTAKLGVAIQTNTEIPGIPETIKKGTTGKVSNGVRAVLSVASDLIMIAQFQITGTGQKILEYIGTILNQLIAGEPVPTISKSLLDDLKTPLDRDHNIAKLDRLVAKVEQLADKSEKRDKTDNRLSAVEGELGKLSGDLHARLASLESKTNPA
jgi:hypothetical protein